MNKKALLIIDYVESCVDGTYYRKLDDHSNRKYSENRGLEEYSKTREILPNMEKLIKICRKNSIPIIWIMPIRFNIPAVPCEYAVENLEDFEKFNKTISISLWNIKPEKGDIAFFKTYYSAFSGTKGLLDYVLKINGINDLIIAGVFSTICINATIIEAFHLKYNITVIEECIATINDEENQAFEKTMIKTWKEYYGDVKSLNIFNKDLEWENINTKLECKNVNKIKEEAF